MTHPNLFFILIQAKNKIVINNKKWLTDCEGCFILNKHLIRKKYELKRKIQKSLKKVLTQVERHVKLNKSLRENSTKRTLIIEQ